MLDDTHSDEDRVTNISSFTWADYESIDSPVTHITALELYRDSVVRPSLKILDTKIDELQRCDQVSADFELLDYAPLFQSTVEGYLLAVQSMWERGLRGMLVNRAKQLSKPERYIGALQRAKWNDNTQSDLHLCFEELLGLSLKAFDSYGDIEILQIIGNALRHGDGASARKLHERCPSLWSNWLAPGTEIELGPFRVSIPPDAPKHPKFADITLTQSVLEQLMQSLIWFWEDLEHIRCNSFRQKHTSVVEKLDLWKMARLARPGNRVWNPS